MNGNDRVRVLIELDPSTAQRTARAVADAPFRILVVGDFAGAGRTALRPTAVEVDRDNLDDVLAALRPAVRFPLAPSGGPEVAVAFSALDDFHPDRLLHTVPLLQALTERRRAAREGRSAPESPPAPEPSAPAAAAAPQAGGSLLDQILDASPSGLPPTPAQAPDPSDLQGFIRSVLAPHRVAPDDPQQRDVVAGIEAGMQDVLRRILHHPDFQALEAAWRGVWLLTRRLETGARLKVHMLDLPRAAFDEDADTATALLQRVIDDADRDGRPWAVLAGLYTFDGSAADAALLGRLADVARRAGAPFLAGAAPRLGGVPSFAAEPELTELEFDVDPAWAALRAQPDAAYVGLALPRFLARLPYDPRDEPCEEIALEEMSAPPSHDEYLWANPSLLAALMLGEAFTERGWSLRPGELTEVGGLPLHLYSDGFESVAQPCAEALLTDRVAQRIVDQGLIPVLSEKNGDAVRLVGFRSLAEPPAPLAGRWRQA